MKRVTPRSLMRLQDRLVRLLGNSVDGRAPLVAGMLRRDASEATSYWFQLVVSVGIATLGLVVGSAAVVIGAMLVSPLLVPIVGLGMGLATGSPFLVLRAAGRIALSVVVAVGGAAIITLSLPFHDLNAEIVARSSPTALDLITAIFCALVAVYAAMRPGSETASTAAGTSISVSLMPPLCASGYGFGTAAWSVAGGAGLLFLTNLVAIVVVGTGAFVAAGFNRVDVLKLERTELEMDGGDARLAGALARRLARLFESRWGPWLRFLMPLVLLAGVFFPLGRALDEVAWEVRVRDAIRVGVERESSRVVQSRARVERHQVGLVVVMLATTEEAAAACARLDRELRRVSGVVPHIEVLAVPDAASVARLDPALLTQRLVASVPAVEPPTLDEQLEASRARLRTAVAELWPATSVGDVVHVDVGVMSGDALRLRIVHLGPPLSTDGRETLQRSIASALGRGAQLIDVAVPRDTLTRADGDLAFVARVASAARATAGIERVAVCVDRPATDDSAGASDVELARALDETLAVHPRVTTTTASAWGVRFVDGRCASPRPEDGGLTAPDAGIPD